MYMQAERPVHWENGAEEHAWNVTILAPAEEMTLTDPRVILVAVANGVMLNEESDWYVCVCECLWCAWLCLCL
jgi:hypothetical protein